MPHDDMSDTELHCWIRYLYYMVQAHQAYPGPRPVRGQSWWQGQLDIYMQVAKDRFIQARHERLMVEQTNLAPNLSNRVARP